MVQGRNHDFGADGKLLVCDPTGTYLVDVGCVLDWLAGHLTARPAWPAHWRGWDGCLAEMIGFTPGYQSPPDSPAWPACMAGSRTRRMRIGRHMMRYEW